jgi:hypothetical protein
MGKSDTAKFKRFVKRYRETGLFETPDVATTNKIKRFFTFPGTAKFLLISGTRNVLMIAKYYRVASQEYSLTWFTEGRDGYLVNKKFPEIFETLPEEVRAKTAYHMDILSITSVEIINGKRIVT